VCVQTVGLIVGVCVCVGDRRSLMWTTRRWRSRSRAPFFFASYSYFCLPNADVAAALQSNGTSERARIRIQIQSSFAPRRRRSRSFAGLVRFPHSLLLSGSLSPACHPLFFARSPALARPQNVSTHSLSPPCPVYVCVCVCMFFLCGSGEFHANLQFPD